MTAILKSPRLAPADQFERFLALSARLPLASPPNLSTDYFKARFVPFSGRRVSINELAVKYLLFCSLSAIEREIRILSA